MRPWRFVLGDTIMAVAGAFLAVTAALTRAARRAYLVDDPEPFFAAESTFDDLSDREWAEMMVLHAEGVHGCDHTEEARRGIGMAGPRWKGITS